MKIVDKITGLWIAIMEGCWAFIRLILKLILFLAFLGAVVGAITLAVVAFG